MKTELYTITTLTNMHAGSGDINFDVIDKQVQRDVTTTLPIIHSSSLKGALRESFAEYEYDEKENKLKKKADLNLVKYIFGPENNSEDNTHQTGAYNFFEAQLLARPVRSNKKAFFHATSIQVIKNFLDTIKTFDIGIKRELKEVLESFLSLSPKEDEPLIFEDIEDVVLEDFKAKYNNFDDAKLEKLQKLLGADIALFHDSDFKKLDLPILARNHLEMGVSQNLWYEEIVPKKTKFFFCISKPTNLDEADKKEKLDKFENSFENKLKKVIQIGANKSIGYGYSKIEKVSS